MKFNYSKMALLTAACFASLITGCKTMQQKPLEERLLKPVIAGEWKHIFNPNVKHKEPKGAWYTNDHTFVQTKDGRWHAYGIIGHRPARPWGGENQFFHASADKLTDLNWEEHDYALVTNKVNERVLWAPHIFKEDGKLHMFYNAGTMLPNAQRMCSYGTLHLATSDENDGFNWQRHDRNPLFSDPGHARDAFVMKENGKYYFYYTKTVTDKDMTSTISVRTGPDKYHWSGPKVVNRQKAWGNCAGYAESPFVVKHDGIYYLFVCVAGTTYDLTKVYWSEDPEDFPEENLVTELKTHAPEIIEDNGKWYISNTGWYSQGLYLAPLKWEKLKK